MISYGASFYVTPHNELFTSYSKGDYGNIKMGNIGASKIVGIGDIWLETNLGSKLLLKHVKHALNMCLNLISTSRLDDEGFTSWFSASKWKLIKKSLCLAS